MCPNPLDRAYKMNEFDRQTLEFYADQADTYAACRPDDINPEIPGFLELLTANARILELGCGGGADAEYMIAKGFDVDPTDGVSQMAALAETRLGCSVRVMRFDQINAVEAYDAVIASASLLHVPVTGLTPILARIWRALRPGGWHLATYKTSDTARRDEYGRYYNCSIGSRATGRRLIMQSVPVPAISARLRSGLRWSRANRLEM
jgi:2-polyprenyl-3-methyl-5-hydroxy-6-metoxy-1,4-benzoquinol methylase